MSPDYPDSGIYPEIYALNREFLRLLTRVRGGQPSNRFGLDEELVLALCALPQAQIDRIAAVPCLLMEIDTGQPGIRDSNGTVQSNEVQSNEVCVFVAGLLTCARDILRYESAGAFAALGIREPLAGCLNSMSMSEINKLAAGPDITISARFSNQQHFWRDLVQAAAQNDRRLSRVSRLSALPLLVAEAHCL